MARLPVGLLHLAALIALAPGAGPAAAQGVASGVVARVAGKDTLPVAGLPIVLHRVGADRQGPVDTVRSDANGRFRVRIRKDSTANWLLSARWSGIEYFSQAVGANPAIADTIILLVSDTSSRAPVAVRQRTLLVSRPDESGSRLVLDWFVLANNGTETRVAPNSVQPAWGTPLPSGVQNVELADTRLSQFAPEAVSFRGDSVLVTAPLSPGQKDLMLQYRIPGTARRVAFPATPMDSAFVLLEERSGRVSSPPMARTDSQVIEGRPFWRWSGRVVAPDSIVLHLAGPRFSPGQVLGFLVAALILGFVLAARRVLGRRRPGARAAPVPVSPAALAERIARLDAAYLDAKARTPAEEWSRYQAERARLKAELVRRLGGAGMES